MATLSVNSWVPRILSLVLSVFLLSGCSESERKSVRGSAGRKNTGNPDASVDKRPDQRGQRRAKEKIDEPGAPRERMEFRAFGIRVRPTSDSSPEVLSVGSRMPNLDALRQPSGVSESGGGQPAVQIVHFWAPWNALSLQSLRMFQRLQQDLEGQFSVTHVTEESPEGIQQFLGTRDVQSGRLWGEQTPGIFLSDTEGLTRASWLRAAGFTELPVAFLGSSDGTLQWFGDAGALERPLRQIIAGNSDPGEAAMNVGSRAAIYEGISRGVGADGLLAIARLAFESAPNDPEAAMNLLGLLLETEDYQGAEAVAAATLALCKDSPTDLNQLAWLLISISDSPRAPLSAALAAAQRAATLTGRSSDALETLARVHFLRKDYREAVSVQTESLLGATSDRRVLLEAVLQEYQRAAAAEQARR
ncbi:MAG: Thioredoxin [Planctomycetota bacterium]